MKNNTYSTQNNETLSVEYTYRIYRLLIFIIFMLCIVRFMFNEFSEIDQIKYILSATSVFMFMERYYPSVTINR
jgi:hypothetical protein